MLIMKYFILIFALLNLHIFSLLAADDYPNSAYLGLSTAYNLDAGHIEFSLMGGYDRHFGGTPEFTLGLLAEGVFSEHSYFLLGVPIGFYPVENLLKLWLAPCYSLNGSGKNYYTVDDVEYFKSDSEFILKFGVGYSYHFKQSRIAMLSFIEGSVIGSEFILGIGVKFNFHFTDDFR